MADGLQFDKAQFASGNHCTRCQVPLQDSYYRFFQDTVCPSCAAKITVGRHLRESESGGLGRAALFGAGAAIGGSIIYGAVLLMGFQIGLVAILNGWMVGKAMMRGSNGIAGRSFQVVAVILTYLSITGGYIPLLVKQMAAHQRQKTAVAVKIGGADAKMAGASPQAGPAKPPLTGPTVAIASVFALFVAAVFIPLLSIASISGVIGAFIIFVGLRQAWRETAGTPFELHGPHPYTPPEARRASA